MKQLKLRRIHVVIIGAVVCIIVGVGMFFVLIKPSNKQLADANALLQQFQTTGTQANVDTQKKDVAAALKEVADAQNNLDHYMRAKMPDLSFADRPGNPPGTGRASGMYSLWTEQSQTLGPLLTKWIGTHGGVKLESQVNVPAAPIDPNSPSFEQDIIPIPIGKVKVTGSYQDIINNIRSWRSCGRLVSINTPTFTGSSPKLNCEYDVTVYIMPRFKADKSKPLGIAGAPAAGGVGAPMPAPAPPPGPTKA